MCGYYHRERCGAWVSNSFALLLKYKVMKLTILLILISFIYSLYSARYFYKNVNFIYSSKPFNTTPRVMFIITIPTDKHKRSRTLKTPYLEYHFYLLLLNAPHIVSCAKRCCNKYRFISTNKRLRIG